MNGKWLTIIKLNEHLNIIHKFGYFIFLNYVVNNSLKNVCVVQRLNHLGRFVRARTRFKTTQKRPIVYIHYNEFKVRITYNHENKSHSCCNNLKLSRAENDSFIFLVISRETSITKCSASKSVVPIK